MQLLRDKRTLMTGVTGVLGPALVDAFLALGADVLAVGRRRTALDDLRAGAGHHERLHTAECDVCDPEGVEALFDAWARKGSADIVVHAAGAWKGGAIVEHTDEDVRAIIESNLSSAAFVLRAALRRMHAPASVIVVAASDAQTPSWDGALYGAAKAGVVHLARAAAALGDVRVNALLPGELDGERAKEVARAAVWLAGGESGGVNGACVRLS
jgi:NAD(P)-dependent dehydrogenase (short-subunit alcohol dehydrogenase family)